MRKGLRDGWAEEIHTPCPEAVVLVMNVLASERAVEKGAYPVFMAGRREEQQSRLRARDCELDPAPVFNRAIRRDDEAHDVCPEGQREILITGWDADVVEFSDHG